VTEPDVVEEVRGVRRPRGPDTPRWWRYCPACGYEWTSDTIYGPGDVTMCPKCRGEVPGELRGRFRGWWR